LIKFINDENVVFRRVLFTYSGNQIQQIEWDHMTASGDFLIDRKVSFAFFPDGNLKTMTDHRLFPAGTPEHSYITTFEQYDNKINVDDFSLVHDGIHDHLFLLQGFRLQKNNPGKETFSVDGVTFYTESYTYTSNGDNTPSTKIGDFVYASGPDAGKRFETSTFYTYY
ncbi:MAG TPA: hypothetical protein VK666_04145, partial [Chryseolinea sp.]|nr:hypothetical protein [Chryseolinea sp.]